MSKRFYFDVDNGEETIRDDEGVEAEDLEQALADARSVIREMDEELVNSTASGKSFLIVRDETGSPVARLPIENSRHRFSQFRPQRRAQTSQAPSLFRHIPDPVSSRHNDISNGKFGGRKSYIILLLAAAFCGGTLGFAACWWRYNIFLAIVAAPVCASFAVLSVSLGFYLRDREAKAQPTALPDASETRDAQQKSRRTG